MKTSQLITGLILAGGAAYLWSKKSGASTALVATTSKPPVPVANKFYDTSQPQTITVPDVTLNIAPDTKADGPGFWDNLPL